MTDRSSPRTTDEHKDAVIAAIATILAAVIVAAGGIVASARNAEDTLRRELEGVRAELAQKSYDAKVTAASIADLRAELRRVRADQVSRLQASSPTQEQSRVISETARRGALPLSASVGAASDETELQSVWLWSAVEERNGFTITAHECRRSGGSVTCHFEIQSDERERRVSFMSGSSKVFTTRAYDSAGGEYASSGGSIGTQSGDEISVVLPHRVSIRGAVTFRHIPREATKLVLLQYALRVNSGGILPLFEEFKIEFRNVPIAA